MKKQAITVRFFLPVSLYLALSSWVIALLKLLDDDFNSRCKRISREPTKERS